MYFQVVQKDDWPAVRRNFQKIESNLFGPAATPTFSGITLSGGDGLNIKPGKPIVVGSLYNVNFNNAGFCYVSGDYCYISGWSSDSFSIVDVSDPTNPVLISQIVDNTDLNGCECIVVVGNYAYCTPYLNNSITVVDVSDKTNPAVVAVLQDATNLGGVLTMEVSGHYLWCGTYNTDYVTSVDISDPLNPIVVGSVSAFPELNQCTCVVPKGDYAYCVGRNEIAYGHLAVIDISDPANPSLVDSITDAKFDRASVLDIKGRYAYISGSDADYLSIVDISDPTNMSIVGSVTNAVLDNIYTIQVEGNYVYAATRDYNGFVIIDVSDPTDPTILTSVQDNTNLEGADDVFIYGNYAYVTCTDAKRLTILKLNGLQTPTADIGNLAAHRINVSENAIFGKNITVADGITVGQRGIGSVGSIVSNEYLEVRTGTDTPAILKLTSKGGTGADAFIICQGDVAESTVWSFGSDDTGQSFRISESAALGTNDRLIIDEGGVFHLNSVTVDDTGTRTIRIGDGTDNGDAGTDNTFLGYMAGYNNNASGNYLGVAEADGDRNVYIGQYSGYGATGGVDIGGSENVAVGAESLYYCTTGYENTCVGDEAGKGITSGHGNVCLGNDAMQGDGTNPVTGNFNTSLGTDTLYVVQAGGYNVAVGYQCLFTTTDDSYNVGVGYQSLHTCNGGENNVGLGYRTLYKLTTGDRNFAVGPDAGYNLTIGNDNIHFGYQAGYKQTTAGNDLIIGYQAGFNNNGDPTIGQNVLIGYQAFYNDNGQYNVGLGYQVGYNNDASGGDGDYNVYIGHKSGYGNGGSNNTGEFNVGVGFGTLYDNTTGSENIAIGASALNNNTTGKRNVAVGYGAMISNSGGRYNFGLGTQACGANTLGFRNIGIGFHAVRYNQQGSGNIGIGYYSCGRGPLANQTNLSFNLCIGTQSGYNLSSGANNNIMIGSYCGDTLTTGDSNTFIGHKTGGIFTTGSSNVFIGAGVGDTNFGAIGDSNLFAIDSTDTATPLIAGYFAAHASGPKLFINGACDIGDGTNKTVISANGLQTMEGTARIVRDLWIDAGGIKAPASNPAALISHGVLETPAWQFADAIVANRENVSASIKLPTDMDKTVAPVMCVGWSTTTIYTNDATDNETIEWQLEYLYTQINESTAAAAEDTKTVSYTLTASTVAEGLVTTVFAALDVPNANDVCIHVRLTRLSNGVGPAGTDTIADDVELHGLVLQYTSNKLGTAT